MTTMNDPRSFSPSRALLRAPFDLDLAPNSSTQRSGRSLPAQSPSLQTGSDPWSNITSPRHDVNANLVVNAPILCLTHCDPRRHVLCLVLPPVCPICRSPWMTRLTRTLDMNLTVTDSDPSATPTSHSSHYPDYDLVPFCESCPRMTSLPGSHHHELLKSPMIANTDASLGGSSLRHNDRGFTRRFLSGKSLEKKREVNFNFDSASSQSPTFTPLRASSNPPPSAPSTLAVFQLPSPFRRGCDSPCSVVVRPSVGTFLDEYRLYDDLHIGIADSNGVVHDFDKGETRPDIWGSTFFVRRNSGPGRGG